MNKYIMLILSFAALITQLDNLKLADTVTARTSDGG